MKEEQITFPWPIAVMQGLPAAALGLYVFGFLATNIHLGKFGVFDFYLFSSRYFIVGFLFFLFLVIWSYFAGRSLLHMYWYGPGIEYDNSFGSSLVLWIELIFSICVSTALFSLIFLGAAEAIFFCALAMILCMIEPWWENLWESKGLSIRFPAVDLMIYPVIRVLSIIVLFSTIEVNSLVTILFVQFSVMSIYGRFVIGVVKGYRSERRHHGSRKEDILPSIAHVCVFAILSSAAFAWLHYGHINPGLGGGQSQSVEIIVADAIMSKSLEDMGFAVSPSFKADLVHEDKDQVIVSVGSKTVQLSKASIAGVKVFTADSSGLERYARRIWDELTSRWKDVQVDVNNS